MSLRRVGKRCLPLYVFRLGQISIRPGVGTIRAPQPGFASLIALYYAARRWRAVRLRRTG